MGGGYPGAFCCCPTIIPIHCCGDEEGPAQMVVFISGVSSPGSCLCTAMNGFWTLNYVGSGSGSGHDNGLSGCKWEILIDGRICDPSGSQFAICYTYAGGTGDLRILDLGDNFPTSVGLVAWWQGSTGDDDCFFSGSLAAIGNQSTCTHATGALIAPVV